MPDPTFTVVRCRSEGKQNPKSHSSSSVSDPASRRTRGFKSEVLACLMVASVLLSGCSLFNHKEDAPPVDYAAVSSAFTIGTIALESGDLTGRDRTYLTKVTQLAPNEPAGWANLGLREIRSNNLPAAAADLKKASELAPKNAGIAKLLAILADRQGNLNGALEYSQSAVKLAPEDIRAHYALAQLLSRQFTPEADTQYQQEIQAIVDRQPSNLIAELNLATIAARRNDRAALSSAVKLLSEHGASFAPGPSAYLKTLSATATSVDVRSAAVTARYLENTLKTNPAYGFSFASLMNDPKTGVGDPLFQFIKLAPMNPRPDSPDETTHFTAQPFVGASWAQAVYLEDNGKQALLTASGGALQLPNKVSLPIPGGSDPGIHGLLSADFNYDLKSDLLLSTSAGIELYLQGKTGGFTDATASMKLPAAVVEGKYTGAWAIDIESDGDLDALLGTVTGPPVLLLNHGDGTWGVSQPFKGIDGVIDFALGDLDGDGNLDVALIDAALRLHVYMNDRAGLFVERKLPDTMEKCSAVAAADLRGDGKVSLLALTVQGKVIKLSDVNNRSNWDVAEIASWNAPPSDLNGPARLMVADLDNNGALDLVASTATASSIWLADPNFTYKPIAAPFPGSVSGLAAPETGGLIDLIGFTNAPNGKRAAARFQNGGSKNYHWQDLRPRAADTEFKEGKGDRRVNSFAIGGEIEARAGLLYEKLTIDAPTVHFGLGTHAALDAVRILWPNGDIRAEFADALKRDQVITLTHRLVTSCPFLFTWNGKEMQFVTDCIWRSPLGLKINAQDTAGVAMTEDWVKIRGDQLVPDANGQYDLRITAELWETHFFDHLSLITVDHEAGTEIFVDERFAIPPPPLKVNLMTGLQPVNKAVDDLGVNVTALVAAQDGQYLDTFGRGKFQGVTRDHYVEIELPEAQSTGATQWLVCNGFIHPTNSSINVALGQSHDASPTGLQIETPDSAGKWSVARAGLGFPEGKIKTILIDVTNVFKPGAPHKLRLRTNLEIYWDRIAWATGLPSTQADLLVKHLSPSTADLLYRGFSVIKTANPSSPDLPVGYDTQLTERPQWRDLAGYCTRYGDVRELLEKVDDRYVIMNAGDEIRMKFNAPGPPPAGYVRDYVLIGDGWVKDGDFNTTFSKTVLPLPEHATSSYAVPPNSLEGDPVYKKHSADWSAYHTRYVSPDRMGQRLKPGPIP